MASGGRRDGAGRKPSPVKKTTVTIRLPEATKRRLHSLKTRTGMAVADIIETMAVAMDEQLKSCGK